MNKLTVLIAGFKREPVLGFGLVGLVVAAYAPALIDDDAKKAFVAGLVLFLQRAFSTPTTVAAQNVEVGKYVGAVEHQAVATAAQVYAQVPATLDVARVAPARRTRQKAT